MDHQTRTAYRNAGFGRAVPLGVRPAVLVVDLIRGFTDPDCVLGADLTDQVRATRRVLDTARARGFPVVFTTIQYEPNLQDCPLWLHKLPGLAVLQAGRAEVTIDPGLDRADDETIIVKKGPSAFFGTNLSSILIARRVDTVVLCGASTSGCIRATAVDLLQYGFPTLVPRECVGDRAKAPHDANLIDIDAKYANVTSMRETLEYLDAVGTPTRSGAP